MNKNKIFILAIFLSFFLIFSTNTNAATNYFATGDKKCFIWIWPMETLNSLSVTPACNNLIQLTATQEEADACDLSKTNTTITSWNDWQSYWIKRQIWWTDPSGIKSVDFNIWWDTKNIATFINNYINSSFWTLNFWWAQSLLYNLTVKLNDDTSINCNWTVTKSSWACSVWLWVPETLKNYESTDECQQTIANNNITWKQFPCNVRPVSDNNNVSRVMWTWSQNDPYWIKRYVPWLGSSDKLIFKIWSKSYPISKGLCASSINNELWEDRFCYLSDFKLDFEGKDSLDYSLEVNGTRICNWWTVTMSWSKDQNIDTCGYKSFVNGDWNLEEVLDNCEPKTWVLKSNSKSNWWDYKDYTLESWAKDRAIETVNQIVSMAFAVSAWTVGAAWINLVLSLWKEDKIKKAKSIMAFTWAWLGLVSAAFPASNAIINAVFKIGQ